MASSTSSSPPSASSTNGYSPSQWTQQNVLWDMLQQKGVLIGIGMAMVGLWLFSRTRSKPQQKAARRLVRDWRRVDDVEDARDLLGANVPPIVRPAMLIALAELERQVHRAFRRLEKQIHAL